VLILGCGYVGRRLARRILAGNAAGIRLMPEEALTCVARNPAPMQPLEDAGARVLTLDLAQDELDGLTTAGERVFHFAPPAGDGREDPLTARLVDAFDRLGNPRRLVYISTTGVYGDCGGAWVDESWPPRPLADRSFRRLDAEQRLGNWADASGAGLVILRVAGIYGPDRLPLARIRSGQPLVRLEDAPWSNRIHADDLVEVCLAAMDRAPAGAVYNVCDGHPSTMTDYFFQIADRAGVPRPPQISLEAADGRLSPGMLSYMRESRRLSNRRMCDELGVTLRYPTLEAGLADLPASL
jgi:nucleoside-diphosphate-sugar epimerase